MFDPYKIREDFPVIKKKIYGKPLVYFDNAATTLKPKVVIEAISEFYREYSANVHRGLHFLSQKASEIYEETHEVIAKFINAKAEEIVFTYNTTYAINMVAYSWGLENIKKGDKILLTIMEHHSNMLPWRRIAKICDATIEYVDIKNDYTLNMEDFESKIDDRTRVVAVTLMSNVLGTINDVRKIAKLAHEVGAIVVADGAQAVPHMPVNVRDLGIDFLAFSGHKMLGPMGIGVLWGKSELLENVEPAISGGGTIRDVTLEDVSWGKLPEKFEAGTPNVGGAIGLAEAAKYLMKLGTQNIRNHEKQLTKQMMKLMREELDDYVEYYGPENVEFRGGIVPFNVKGMSHHAVAAYLDTEGIAVRSGLHCAHPLHYRLGLKGTIRASLYIYNTKEEIEYFINALKKLVKKTT